MLDGLIAEARPDRPSPALMLDGQGAEARPDRPQLFYVYNVRKETDPSAIDRRLFIDIEQTAATMHPCSALQTCPEFYTQTFEDMDEALLYRKIYDQAKPGHRLDMYEAIVSGECKVMTKKAEPAHRPEMYEAIVSGEFRDMRLRMKANIHNVSSF